MAQHVHAGQQVQSATLDGADKRRRAPAAMAGGAGGAVGVPGLPPSSRVIGGWAPSQYLGRLANTAGVVHADGYVISSSFNFASASSRMR